MTIKLVVNNTDPLAETRTQETNPEHIVGYAIHDLTCTLGHLRGLAKAYPDLMAANMHIMSELFREWAEFYSGLSK